MSITANTEEAKKKSSKSTDRKLRDRSKMKPVDYAADDTAVEEEEVENYKDADDSDEKQKKSAKPRARKRKRTKRDGQPKKPPAQKAKPNDGAVLAVMQRPAERNKTMLSQTGALTVQKAIAAFGPWKKMMQKKRPDVLPHNYVSFYYATLDLPPSAGCEGHIKKLLQGSRTLEIAPSTGGRPVAYPPHEMEALLEYIVKDAKEEGLTVEKLYEGHGQAGSIIKNKAETFLGNTYGHTFTSKEDKKKLQNHLRTRKPKIEEALKEEALMEEALKEEALKEGAGKEKAGKGMDI